MSSTCEWNGKWRGERGRKKCVCKKYKIDNLTAFVWVRDKTENKHFAPDRSVGDTPKFDEQIFTKRSILLLSSFRMHNDVRPVICSNCLRYAKFTTISSSALEREREMAGGAGGRHADRSMLCATATYFHAYTNFIKRQMFKCGHNRYAAIVRRCRAQ